MADIVQSTKFEPTAVAASIDFVLGQAPVEGNLLLALTAYAEGESRAISPPGAGWTKLGEIENNSTSFAAWTRQVQNGDGDSYSFAVSGSAGWHAGVLYEIEEQSGVERFAFLRSPENPPASPALRPQSLGTLAMAAAACQSGPSLSSVSAGWSIDQQARGNALGVYYTGCYGVHKNALSTDTSTALSTALTFASARGDAIYFLVLISGVPKEEPLFLGLIDAVEVQLGVMNADLPLGLIDSEQLNRLGAIDATPGMLGVIPVRPGS